MKVRLIAIAALILAFTVSAGAQEKGGAAAREGVAAQDEVASVQESLPAAQDESGGVREDAVVPERAEFEKTYSIELGTGLPPFFMRYMPNSSVKKSLAQKGQEAIGDGAFYPVISLTGVMRTGLKTEFTATVSGSWCYNNLVQYPQFGTDPNGQPRYDLTKGLPAGRLASSPTFTLMVQYRHLWNPKNAFVLYSGVGFGFSSGLMAYRGNSVYPSFLPSLTPLAFRLGGQHFYGFAECTIGPVASYVHGGLGWRF